MNFSKYILTLHLLVLFDNMFASFWNIRDTSCFAVLSSVGLLPLFAVLDDSVLPLCVQHMLGHMTVTENLPYLRENKKCDNVRLGAYWIRNSRIIRSLEPIIGTS